MNAGSILAGYLAGMLSTLSPCVLPILPLVVGTAVATHRLGALVLAAGLAVSFTAIGLFVATIGFAMGLDGGVFRMAAALMLAALGLVLLVGPLLPPVCQRQRRAGRWRQQAAGPAVPQWSVGAGHRRRRARRGLESVCRPNPRCCVAAGGEER